MLFDEKVSEEVSNLLGDFISATISDESGHGSPESDIVIEGVDKLFLAFDAISITYQGVSSNKELGHGTTIIDGWGVTEDGISGNSLISSWDVEDRVPGLEMLLEVIMSWNGASKS